MAIVKPFYVSNFLDHDQLTVNRTHWLKKKIIYIIKMYNDTYIILVFKWCQFCIDYTSHFSFCMLHNEINGWETQTDRKKKRRKNIKNVEINIENFIDFNFSFKIQFFFFTYLFTYFLFRFAYNSTFWDGTKLKCKTKKNDKCHVLWRI